EPCTPGHFYRVKMYSEALASRGCEVCVVEPAQAGMALPAFGRDCALIIWRSPWNKKVSSLVDAARSAGAKVVFDVDDRMFEPKLAKIEVIDGIRTQGFQEAGVAEFYRQVRHTLRQSDFATCTTQPLATAMRRQNKPAIVLPNGFDEATLARSRQAAARRR